MTDANFTAAEILADIRFQRHVELLHRRGPRVVAETMAMVGAATMRMHTVEEIVQRFLEIDPDALEVTGGDRMPPVLLQLVKP